MKKKSYYYYSTLNENDNILFLYEAIVKKQKIPILFIDDSSNDGTRDKILSLSKKNKMVKFIFRAKRYGIGSAHKEGIFWAYDKKYESCITMDADRTHNPLEIKKLLTGLKKDKADIIITSRFIKKNSLEDWPVIRKYITKIRYYLVKIVLNTDLDSSGGFRCYNLKTINKKDFNLAKNNGYFFMIESLFYFQRLKYKIVEFPTKLKYRVSGKSKMRVIDVISSFINLFKLSFFHKS